ncbi:MAG: AMP-binding protein, partial [Sphingomonadales bacterium]
MDLLATPQPFSFGAIFEAVANGIDPARPALVHGDTSISWGDYAKHTSALAGSFIAGGAQPGDRIALLMRNGPAWLQTLGAAFRARLVHVNVNYRYTGEELFYILDNSDATVLVFDAEFAPLVASLKDRLAVKLLVQVGGETISGAHDFEALAESATPLPPQSHSVEDMLFIYTGGTTGLPKGVM